MSAESIAVAIAGALLDRGVALLDRLGQKLPKRVRVRSYQEQVDDYHARTAQQEALEKLRAQEKP